MPVTSTGSTEIEPGARRTQKERRTRTQARLLDATIECLAELGWSKTSTTEVARRAGVSRGAQQHHYPTKMSLVDAAVEHLLDQQRQAYEAAFAELPPERHNVEGALDLLWDVFRSPSARAMLELAVASRTDPELHALCVDLNDRVLDLILVTFEQLFPQTNLPDGSVPTTLRTVHAMFVGLSVHNALDDDVHGHQRAVLEQVKSLARQLIPDPEADPRDTRHDAGTQGTRPGNPH
ncbi:TetR/AcrR family transcriptional regulator [Streptomyces boninensis]|uniref:TetR/AcrR family transcriptional regulator n=1 Tax=Streptomyces boninensis TaxID=2039455 RepID=UPI003B2213CB